MWPVRNSCYSFSVPRFAQHLNLDLLPKPSSPFRYMTQWSACLCLTKSRETLILVYGLYSTSTWGPISAKHHPCSEMLPGVNVYPWAECLRRSNFKLKLSSEWLKPSLPWCHRGVMTLTLNGIISGACSPAIALLDRPDNEHHCFLIIWSESSVLFYFP